MFESKSFREFQMKHDSVNIEGLLEHTHRCKKTAKSLKHISKKQPKGAMID